MNRPTNDKCTGNAMFGCFQDELNQYLEGRDTYDLARLIQSMLSDAQQELELGNREASRQIMNRAKYTADRIAKAHR